MSDERFRLVLGRLDRGPQSMDDEMYSRVWESIQAALLVDEGVKTMPQPTQTVIDMREAGDGPPRWSRWRRRALVLAAVAVGVAALALVLIWRGGDENEVVPADTSPTTAVPDAEANAEQAPAGALGPIDTAILTVDTEFVRSGEDLWAWDYADQTPRGIPRLARYRDGTWWRYPSIDATFIYGWFAWDVAELPDGTLLAATRDGLQRLSESGWQPVDTEPAQPWTPTSIEVDPATGTTWISGTSIEISADEAGNGVIESGRLGHRLWRWTADEITPIPGAPDAVFEDIVVAGDGTVWGGGIWSSHGLVGYDDRTGTWQVVEPWEGHPAAGAQIITAAPNGDLWAYLLDTGSEGAGSYARYQTATGQWTVVDASPSAELGGIDSTPWSMAASDDGIWVAAMTRGEAAIGVQFFDGDSWASHLDDRHVTAVGVAKDGTVWVSTTHGVVRVPVA